MQAAAALLVGRHDFTSFRASQCQADSPVRTLDELRIEPQGEELHIHAAARSFLHHQVRNIVGTLALVGAGKWTRRRCGGGAGREGPFGRRADRPAGGAVSDRGDLSDRDLNP